MEKWNDLLKQLFSKKYAANILVLLGLAVIALIITGDWFSLQTPEDQESVNPPVNASLLQESSSITEEAQVEQRLKRILEEIRGVGTVEVMLTFEAGSEIVPAMNMVESKDITEEEDSNGGTRTMNSESVTTNTVISNGSSGTQAPMVLKEIKPQVNGVVVVAEGAEDAVVKTQIYEAVKTVLQLPGHKVQVFPKN